MFDLSVLRCFFESREWQGLSADELKIIKACKTNIKGYSKEHIAFLNDVKESLVREYELHLI